MESVPVPPAEPAPRRAAPGTPLVEVTRAYRFSAAHRLHSPRFSAAENARLYGRCNNPSGHGHTYRLQVTIRGPICPGTGWIADGQRLDEVVGREVVRRFDRTNLDALIGPADGPTSTTEVLAGVIWGNLDGVLPSGRLWRLRLEETPNNFFELDRRSADQSSRPPRPMATDRGQKVSPA
jgi:6-pyruvoyltetrahydropterin/6-carboxytetrahydropterin synthase